LKLLVPWLTCLFAAAAPLPIDHQGIDDPFQEKASSVHYYHAGKWLRLAGAD